MKGIWVAKYPPTYSKDTSDDVAMDSQVNEPNLDGFDKENTYLIKYENNKVKSETKLAEISNIQNFNNDKNWYDYENKIWANIKTTANGLDAYWVWIPRYAYKMPATPNDDIEIIYINENNVPLNTGKYGTSLPNGFTVHPAFTGGNKNSKGIWVAKYPPTYSKDTSDDVAMDSQVNEPNLDGFDKENTYLVKINGNAMVSEKKLSEVNNLQEFNADKNWYDYENKIWANIKTTANGLDAYWVWIPRYAYKMPATPNDDIEIIYINENNVPLNTGKYGTSLPNGFTVHPAFTGGDKNLKGIWVAKYPPTKKD